MPDKSILRIRLRLTRADPRLETLSDRLALLSPGQRNTLLQSLILLGLDAEARRSPARAALAAGPVATRARSQTVRVSRAGEQVLTTVNPQPPVRESKKAVDFTVGAGTVRSSDEISRPTDAPSQGLFALVRPVT